MKKWSIVFFALCLSGCMSEKQLKETLKKNPEILIDTIKENPVKFVEALQEAAQSARAEMGKKREAEEKIKFEKSFENPLKPVIRKNEAIRGPKNAPLVLIEYSDFECPYCTKGFKTVEELRKKYGEKIQFIYKHLPLSFHDKAMISAQYFEALRLQDSEKAFAFHDEIFKNQGKLRLGTKFLDSLVKQVGGDLAKVKKDINSEEVTSKIAEDQKEAASFGMQGTPGFLLNGIPVKGAYPTSYFEMIVNKLIEKGKVKL